MENKYTLISIIGTGMYKNEGYQKTEYQFSNGKTFTTRLFLLSLLETKYRSIEKLILVGTRTSSWDVLISENNEDLWLTIKDECESPDGISDASIDKIQQFLTTKFSIPVVLKVHTPTIDKESIEEIFSIYNEIENDIPRDSHILFDITHGFRSMPILIYQALQFSSAGKNLPRIELVYGEYVTERKISYVRDLSKYWDLSEITVAKNLFRRKLDGSLISEKIAPYWESGAKSIKHLSEIIKCNYSLQIPEVLRQLKNALANFEKADVATYPDWVQDTFDIASDFYKGLSVNNTETFYTSKILRKFSTLLEKKGFITESVITLQVAIEVAITEKYATVEYFGDYDWWQENGRDYYTDIRKKLPFKQKNALWEIEKLRNGIAHGGAKNTETGEYPHTASITKILKNGNAAADIILKQIEEL